MEWDPNYDGFWHRVRQARRILIAVIVLAVLGGLLFYAYSNPRSVPLWAREWLPGLAKYTGPLYRWRDDQGREQISDQPPKGRPYEEVQYRTDANVVPSRR